MQVGYILMVDPYLAIAFNISHSEVKANKSIYVQDPKSITSCKDL